MKKKYSSFSINLSEAKNLQKFQEILTRYILDKMYGLNSFSGEIICHGCLVILKIFKKKKLYNYLKKEVGELNLILISFYLQ